MERDVIKFLITTVTQKYPNFVSKILVFNMPWVLWMVAKPMLPQQTAGMVKFVDNDTIKDYAVIEQFFTSEEVDTHPVQCF